MIMYIIRHTFVIKCYITNAAFSGTGKLRTTNSGILSYGRFKEYWHLHKFICWTTNEKLCSLQHWKPNRKFAERWKTDHLYKMPVILRHSVFGSSLFIILYGPAPEINKTVNILIMCKIYCSDTVIVASLLLRRKRWYTVV